MLMMMSGEDEKDEQGRGKGEEAQDVLREKPNNPNLKDGELHTHTHTHTYTNKHAGVHV